MEQHQHQFQLKTFRAPTQCDLCHRLLWGIARQECRIHIHKKCLANKTLDELGPCTDLTRSDSQASSDASTKDGETSSLRRRVSTTSSISSTSSTTATSTASAKAPSSLQIPSLFPPASGAASTLPPPLLHHRRIHSISGSQPSINSVNSSPSSATAATGGEKRRRRRSRLFSSRRRTKSATSLNLNLPPSAPSDTTPARSPMDGLSLVWKDWLQSTASFDQKRLRRGPAKLNVFTTLPKNFTRFVVTVGPLAEFQERVERVFYWHTPSETLLVMGIYVVLCLNPLLLLLLPQLVCLLLMLGYYYSKAQQESSSLSSSNASSSSSTYPSSSAAASSSASASASTGRSRPDQIHFRKNMQFIQNTMGMYCNLYDHGCQWQAWLNWSDPSRTRLLLQLTIVSMLALLFCYAYIPWKAVFLLLGCIAFTLQTSVGLATRAVLFKYARRPAALLPLKSFFTSNSSATMNSMSHAHSTVLGTTSLLIECVENQRWWAGLGWVPHLLRSERPAWSSLDGRMASRPKQEWTEAPDAIQAGLAFTDIQSRTALPADLASKRDWCWEPESVWAIDTSWTEQAVDDEGWVYSDHQWGPTKKRSNVLTRRRRWIRPVVAKSSQNHKKEE